MTDPRIHARRVEVQRQNGRHRLRIVLGFVVLVLLSAGAVALTHTSLFAARKVVIVGTTNIARSEILGVTGLDGKPLLIDINSATLARRVERLAWVDSATVSVEWPSTVSIAVVERVPVAADALPGGGYALLDSSGRVLEDRAIRPVSLPVIALPQAPGKPGSFLGVSARAVLMAAAALPVSLLPRVDEIITSSAQGVVLRLKGGLEAVLGNDQSLPQKFVSLVTVLNRVNLAGVGGIDLRVATSPVLTPLVSPSNVQGKGDG
jgi:cell division protein FtsQ